MNISNSLKNLVWVYSIGLVTFTAVGESIESVSNYNSLKVKVEVGQPKLKKGAVSVTEKAKSVEKEAMQNAKGDTLEISLNATADYITINKNYRKLSFVLGSRATEITRQPDGQFYVGDLKNGLYVVLAQSKKASYIGRLLINR